jgi:hypothetical protein
VVAWGYNGYGQASVPLAAQSGVVAIAAGKSHTVALKDDGTVLAWGSNDEDEDHGQTNIPAAALNGALAIAAGGHHTVALIGNPVPFNARRSGNELILTWSTNAVGFTLQSTLQLTPPVTWVDVTNAPVLLGTQWTVTNTFSGSAQFYRLQKP